MFILELLFVLALIGFGLWTTHRSSARRRKLKHGQGGDVGSGAADYGHGAHGMDAAGYVESPIGDTSGSHLSGAIGESDFGGGGSGGDFGDGDGNGGNGGGGDGDGGGDGGSSD